MAIKTKIEYCDSTSNLMMGCNGCELWNAHRRSCYAGLMTGRMNSGIPSKGWPADFNKPETFLYRLEKLFSWSDLRGVKRPEKPWLNYAPRVVFLNDMGDPFTESLELDWMLDATREMAKSKHVYLLLTKRPWRMATFFRDHVRSVPENFILGMTATDQPTLAARIASLLMIKQDFPEAKLFLSLEPLLGPINLGLGMDLPKEIVKKNTPLRDLICWITAGGESQSAGGDAARPSNPTWALDVLNDCRENGVPFFWKQWGKYAPISLPVALDSKREDLVVIGPGLAFSIKPNEAELERAADNPYRWIMKGGARRKPAERFLDEQEWNQMPAYLSERGV